MTFQHAQKSRAKVRIGMIGPSGSGKTYSALAVGCKMASLAGGRVAVIDTERGSASLYADRFDFDVVELEDFSPRNYMQAIADAQKGGFAVLVIDSLSHAWTGKGGALEMVDKAAMKSQSANTFAAWRTVTPLHNQLVDTILQANCHVIVTLRSKTEWVIEDGPNGKKIPRKIGLAPIMRDGIEYEFTVCGDLSSEHLYMISKSRCEALADAVIEKPGAALAEQLWEWINTGTAKPARVVDTPKQPPAEKPDEIPYDDAGTHVDVLKHYCAGIAEATGFGEGSAQRAELRKHMNETWRKMCLDSNITTAPNDQTDDEFEYVFQKFRWFCGEVQKGVETHA